MTKDFAAIAAEIGQLVTKKNKAYGNSFAECGKFLALLYPDGVKPEQYGDALLIVRVFDKLMRIATDKDALRESPWRDLAGYGILGASMEDEEVNYFAEEALEGREVPSKFFPGEPKDLPDFLASIPPETLCSGVPGTGRRITAVKVNGGTSWSVREDCRGGRELGRFVFGPEGASDAKLLLSEAERLGWTWLASEGLWKLPGVPHSYTPQYAVRKLRESICQPLKATESKTCAGIPDYLLWPDSEGAYPLIGVKPDGTPEVLGRYKLLGEAGSRAWAIDSSCCLQEWLSKVSEEERKKACQSGAGVAESQTEATEAAQKQEGANGQ